MTDVTAKRTVEVDDYPVKTVDGVPVRVIPLVVRGKDRRKKASPLSDGPVKLTLVGSLRALDSVVILDEQAKRDPITVFVGAKAVMTVDRSQVIRVERRSGVERRKVGK